MAGRAWMALGLLISLGFGSEWLAEAICQFAENINHPNHLRGPDGQAFPLPSAATEAILCRLYSTARL